MSDNNKGKELREALLRNKKNGWDVINEATERKITDYCEDYKVFLDRSKTERDCVAYTVELARAAGFVPLERGMALTPGTKVYRVNRGKAVMLAVVGSAPLDQGVSIVAAHIDSPRLDLKPTPLYEESELAFFKTHYYGGIRKYQWVTIPLELRGVVALKDGTLVDVHMGGQPGEPCFTVDDLLPGAGTQDFYRITLTGTGEEELPALRRKLERFPNLELIDRREKTVDFWENAGEDTLEGTFFRLLQEKMENADPESARCIALAAEISARLLQGREVEL